ncbi:MAG: hypothetical protein AB1921_02255 [Thermodesulfobacteriota bacterium]
MRTKLVVVAVACLLLLVSACGKQDAKNKEKMLGKWTVDVDRTIETLKKTPRYLALTEEQKKQVPEIVSKITSQAVMEITTDSIITSLRDQKAVTQFTVAKTEDNAVELESKGKDGKTYHITVNFLTPDVIQFSCPEAPELSNNVWKRT